MSVLVTIDVQDGPKVTEETFERLASAGGDARFELVNGRLEVRGERPRRWHQHIAKAGLADYWIVGEVPFRPDDGIVARYTNQGGAFQLRDTRADLGPAGRVPGPDRTGPDRIAG